MAITIVDEKPHRDVVKQVVCRNCGCTLEYTPNDVREDRETDYTGSVDIYKRIDCAKCHCPITIGI